MAQELTDYYTEIGVRARYLHSDIDTLERTAILRDLRKGLFDVLIGINLLREGLDLPEVSLVAIMEADKSGFLRNTRSLIQTIGRASRNANGHVILYAEVETPAMREAMSKTSLRREHQSEYNRIHKIEPQTIQRPIEASLGELLSGKTEDHKRGGGKKGSPKIDRALIPKRIKALRKQMKVAAQELEFERAAELRDEIRDLEGFLLAVG
jgi:excinuclease ABC subunit B